MKPFSDKTVSFRVNNRHNYFGHFPITASFDFPAGRVINKSDTYKTRITNWEAFKSSAEERMNLHFDNNCVPREGPASLDNYYQLLGKVIKDADESASVEKTRNRAHRTLPNEILSIIEARKRTINELRKVKTNSLLFREMKTHYNRLTKTIRMETEALKVGTNSVEVLLTKRSIQVTTGRRLNRSALKAQLPRSTRRFPAFMMRAL